MQIRIAVRRHRRRAVPFRSAASVGAVGLAAAVGVGAVAAPALAASRRSTPKPPQPSPRRDLMVYLRDSASGELDVFAGTSYAVIRDPALVARLASAARPTLKRG